MSEYVFILLFHIIISRLIFLSILHNNNRSILYTLRKYKNSMHLTKCVIIYIYDITWEFFGRIKFHEIYLLFPCLGHFIVGSRIPRLIAP